MNKSCLASVYVFSSVLFAGTARATPTENLGIRVLPAPGAVVVDGRANDWDLSAGVFVCDNVETQRDVFNVWLHTMYDADNFYILARWKDPTPLNNPGSVKGDLGFQGDCLQFRIITAPGTPQERTSHWTCWRGREGTDVMDVVYGRKFDEGGVPDAKAQGSQQAFQVDPDGKGYVQEIAIPWKILVKEGYIPKAGDRLNFTVEPNFTVGSGGRMTLKDIFKPDMTLDRVFTFMNSNEWGWASLEPRGSVTPRPVRVADGREFPVRLENGVPAVDWTGVVKTKELQGFKTISLDVPVDGTVSLILKNEDGQVVRQLLNAEFLTKGTHLLKWDGLTTPNWKTPGQPLPAGPYRWSAIEHTGLGLKLRGWADNAGSAPWDDGPTTNWGGDHGVPVAVTTDGERIYLGWSASEAGKAVVASDFQGNVLWRNTHGGIAGAQHVAVDHGTLYILNGDSIYRVDAKTGIYNAWAGSTSTDLDLKTLFPDAAAGPDAPDGMDARAGKLFLSFRKLNQVLVVDDSTGKVEKALVAQAPRGLKAVSDTELDIVTSQPDGKDAVTAIDPQTNTSSTLLAGLPGVTALTVDVRGDIYAGLGEPINQVKVYRHTGRLVRTIGRAGGRAKLGAWTPAGMLFISGLAVDPQGKLWVMEADENPKRVSVWDITTGKLVKEMFGPTHYGAVGGAIDPMNPDIMVGEGCEWRIDSKTGQSSCLGTITRDGMANSRFGVGSNGHLYLAVASTWTYETGPVRIFERLGDARYQLRSMFRYEGKNQDAKTIYWADKNGDGIEQPGEVTTVSGNLRFSSWYMNMAPNMALSAGDKLLKVTGFTACGAPEYDLVNPVKMPIPGTASADGRTVLQIGDYGVNNGWFRCNDITTGKELWTYPDNFVGVHGSHNAPGPEPGLIRGDYGACGVAELPGPIGNIWVLPTNVSEWHILTEGGYYLGRLFQPDPLRYQFPNQAIPGADMSDTPPGMGGEDFGGSIAQGKDGKLYVQAGKVAFWNMEVTGLDTVRSLGSGEVTITPPDVKMAQEFHDRYLQESVGQRRMTIHRIYPTFTGNIDADFKGAEIAAFAKSDNQVRSAAAWDNQKMYLAWDVKDNTPWVNSATEPSQMYIGGDTVDFQLGTDPTADKNRGEAVMGDLRLSIGAVNGTPTAVLYRKVAREKHPAIFHSGVVANYPVDSVQVLDDIAIRVNKRRDGYVVEASVPLSDLELQPKDGLALRGDFGVTYGDPGGQRTRLRSYWSNQHTGIVDDAVFELMMEPKNWGELDFAP